MTWDSTIDGCPYCKAPPGARHALGCIGSPYDGATGVVPRLNPATLRPYAPDHPVDGTRTLPDFGVHGAAIQQAVDDYILMERKARAWDELQRRAEKAQWLTLLVQMDSLVHPAPTSSTR